MANATPVRLGQVNATGGSYANDNAMFLKVFAGEVMAAFAEANIMMPLHIVRTIASGKSAQFPATWKASAAYHTPGNELNGTQIINVAERVINIDDQLVSDCFIADIEEAKNHYDVRSQFTTELGFALARQADKQLLQTATLAARAAATLTGGDAGTALTNAGYATTGATLAAGLFSAAQTFDEKNLPEGDRYCALRPAFYYLLAQTTPLMDKDWGGVGSYAKAQLPEVAGLQVLKSNHVPNAVIGAVTGEQNTYNGTFTSTVGVCWHKSAIGTVKLKDLSVMSQFQLQRLGTLIVARYAMGHGILRPESAVELKSS